LSLIDKLNNYDIELCINNAGFGKCAPFNEIDLDVELQMLAVNVEALHILSKGLINLFIKRNKKSYLLNVASSAGLLPAGPYMATYYASKSYVASLSQALNQEMKELNYPIVVSALCPGPVDTNFNKVADVKFALKGISSAYCVDVALKDLFKEKAIIIPSLKMKTALFFCKLLPRNLMVKICARQQRKKIYD